MREDQHAGAVERARLLRQLGDAYFFLGDFARADTRLEEVLGLLGHSLPVTTGGWLRLAARTLAQRLGRRALGLLGLRPAQAERHGHLEASKAAARRALMGGYRFETVPILALSLLAVELGERGGQESAVALAMLAHAAALGGLSRLAASYFTRARAVAERLHDRPALVSVVLLEAVLLTTTGRFDEALARIEEGLGLALEVRDRVNAAAMEQLQGLVRALRGELPAMWACYERARVQLGGSSESHAQTCTAGVALSLALLGRHEEARQAAEPCLDRVPPELRLTRAALLVALTLAEAWSGRLERACRRGEEAYRCYGVSTAVPPPCNQFLEAPIEAYVTAWRQARAAGDVLAVSTSRRRARALAREIGRWARLYPIGRPMADFYRGEVAALDGAGRRARRAWRRCLQRARALRMPWYEARAHLALGTGGEPDCEGHLRPAQALFDTMEARHHGELARRALAGVG